MSVTSVMRVPADRFIAAFAAHLKNEGTIKVPNFANFVKTGCSRKNAPACADWFYIKAASVMRHFYVSGTTPLGVSTLAGKYSHPASGRSTPHHTRDASRKVIRSIVQQFAGQNLLLTRDGEARHISPNGRKMVEEFANSLLERKD
ncbi:Ribosomal protein S19e [Giardia muris]|uniref:Ribosomal protein S19e n=1 Tax=Giardia muris TaxID=5742 RepID=A0A4Z1SLT2_GIAMU|nr:Ribosomal protein S19e [Giardia muris]|eukprot:TNJ26500.1 Ribosomal protein S19e [Giardia muris]